MGVDTHGTPAVGADIDVVDRLSAELLRHARLLQALRSILSSWSPGGLDQGAYMLLMHLVKQGPRRQGELADCLLIEPSTVSRRVGQLVGLGYVERRADPVDGRAVQLVATAAGHAVYEGVRVRREQMMQQLLARWDAEDVAALERLLRRLNDDLDEYRPLLARATAAEPVPPFPGTASTG